MPDSAGRWNVRYLDRSDRRFCSFQAKNVTIVKRNSLRFVDAIIVGDTHTRETSAFIGSFSVRLGRICGLLFCSRCCVYEPQAKLAGFSESNIRLCSYCSSTLLKIPKPTTVATTTNQSYHLSSSSTASAQIDPQQHSQSPLDVQDPTLSDAAFNSDHFSLSKSSNDRLLVNVDNEQTNNTNEQNLTDADSTSKSTQPSSLQQRANSNFNLKTLFNELFRTSQGLQMQKQRHRLRTIECIQGKEIVDWLMKHQRATVLSEAKLLCQCFVNETYLEPVVMPQTSFVEFKPDQTLYKLGKVNFDSSSIDRQRWFLAWIRTWGTGRTRILPNGQHRF